MTDGKCLILEQCVSDQPIKVSGKVGMRVPCYSCAPGKSILAELPEEELKEYLKSCDSQKVYIANFGFKKLFRKELQKVKESGFAVDLAEGLGGIHCVSAVVLDDYAYPVGAITTIAPAFRLPPERFDELGAHCLEAAINKKKILE